MNNRLLKRISVAFPQNNAVRNEEFVLKDLEIWTSRSKLVSKHIQSIDDELKFMELVNPIYIPIWAIIDKPYDVYTSNPETLDFFETIANRSDLQGNVISNSILVSILNNIFVLFYTEKVEDELIVKCILLDLDLSKLKDILLREDTLDSTHFIDEITDTKDDLIDTLLKQRSANFSNLHAKRQAELTIKDQQLKKMMLRQDFKKIISREVKKRSSDKSKASQNEAADICYRAISFRFKDLLEIGDSELVEIEKWLDVFLSVLGLKTSK